MTIRPPMSVRSPRVLNARRDGFPSGAIYVGRGRGSKLGNPFMIGQHGTRDGVCVMHEEWFVNQSDLLVLVRQLRGRDLVCWCAPERCHADLYLRLANASWEEFQDIIRQIHERAARRTQSHSK
jgi:hypothetical protein